MNRKKPSYESRRKRLVRIVCFIMAALMVLGSMYMLFNMLIFAVSAASPINDSADDINRSMVYIFFLNYLLGF